jgi:sortase (surface protein transpeptidase)
MSEVIVYYHLYKDESEKPYWRIEPASLSVPPVVPIEPQGKVSTLFLKISKLTALVGLALVLFFFTPKALAWGQGLIATELENFRISKVEVQTIKSNLNVSKPAYNPPFDPALPIENSLVIPSIGVNTDIQEATLDNYEAALQKGVWRVSDFGAPNDNAEPIILAAHRYGYLSWTNSFRHKNSFYNLPKVETGDVIEIDWSQKRYLYEVYAVSKGTQILDYSADLILYTCETLTGEEKVFVYAHLMRI